MKSFQNKQAQKPITGRLITGEDVSFRAIEAYKIARTNIMFTLAGKKGCKIIVVTSSVAGEGKTTSSINLAVTFAQMNAKVLLIDADLRRPKVNQYMEERNEEGLADLLAGFVDISDVIRYSEKQGIDYISAGHIPPNPAELLATPRMEQALSELSEVYDYIFLDSPPVTLVADALVMAKYANGVLVVLKQNETPIEMMKKTISSLEFAEAKILGFLMNESEEKQYSYSYSYRKKYSYDYSSYANHEYVSGPGYGDRNPKPHKKEEKKKSFKGFKLNKSK